MNAPAAATPAAAHAGPSLDELIFVELCGRALQATESGAGVKPNAPTLAKLSLELADAYRAAHKEKLAAAGPKNVGYEINMDDLTNWQK